MLADMTLLCVALSRFALWLPVALLIAGMTLLCPPLSSMAFLDAFCPLVSHGFSAWMFKTC